MAAVPENLAFLKPSTRLGSTVLFVAGEHTYDVDDAVASAAFRGELDAAIRTILQLAAAEESFDGEPAPAKLQKAADDFRYRHDLVTAGETEEWLEARGMTVDDFSRWIYQRLCLDGAMEGNGESAMPEDPSDLLRVHLWMSDEMERLTSALGRRVAADREMMERGQTLDMANARQRFLARQGLIEADLPGWLAAIGRDDRWLAGTLRAEAAFESLRARAVTAEARRRKLTSMQLSLVKMEIELLQMDSEAAAREAFLCVREDGATLAGVAADSGYCAERSEMWIDAADDTLKKHLLGAAQGDVIGPIHDKGRFKVYQILRRTTPAVSDPEVAERIDRVITDEFFDELCSRHVHARDVARIVK